MSSLIHPYLAKYPFLSDAKEILSENSEEANKDSVRDRASERIISGINTGYTGPIPSDSDDEILQNDEFSDLLVEIQSYPVARIIISCIDDHRITRQYAKAEAKTARKRLQSYDILNIPTTQQTTGAKTVLSIADITTEFDIQYTETTELNDRTTIISADTFPPIELHNTDSNIPHSTLTSVFDSKTAPNDSITGTELVSAYASTGTQKQQTSPLYKLSVPEFLSHTHANEYNWNLSTQGVVSGHVRLTQSELFNLIEEELFHHIHRDLPHDVPAQIKDEYAEYTEYTEENISEDNFTYTIDRVEEGLFPPLIKQMLKDFPHNLGHNEKVTLASFLLHIGLDVNETLEQLGVVGTKGEAPTREQVKHIKNNGGDGEPYVPANYETIETWNYNWEKDKLEQSVKNPLSYYTIKLKEQDENNNNTTD